MKPIEFKTTPQRILIIKPSAIGDVVHSLPILNLIRKKWPSAHIGWVVTPACAGLVERHPQVDEIILFERRGGFRSFLKLGKTLKSKHFDLVIDLQGLARSGWMCWQTRSKFRVGFANARELAWLAYSHRVPIATMEQHAIERYLTIAEMLGCPRGPVEFNFAVDDADRVRVRKLTGEEPYVVLMPGTNWATKRWPASYFGEVVAPLREKYGLRAIVSGGKGDIELARVMSENAKSPLLDLCGQTNLRETVALLERASLVIANDSGPMHIAAALGRPLVTPYGPTNPVRTGPYGRMESVVRLDIVCSPCYSRSCSHTSCMNWLKPELLISEVGKWMKDQSAIHDH